MVRFWQSRMVAASGRYADLAPMAPACCNVCRACTTTNVVTLASGGAVALGAVVWRLVRRARKPARD